MPDISEAKILMIATDGYEDSELLEPRRILQSRGAEVVLASLETGEIEGDNGATVAVDRTIDEVEAGDYDALILPGGTKNPDALRMDARVVATIRAFAAAGKPVAAICHGPWLLIEADLVRGRRVTGWPSIRTDLRNGRSGAEAERAASLVLLDPDPEVIKGMGLPVDSHRAVLADLAAGCQGTQLGADFRLAKAGRAFTPTPSGSTSTTCLPRSAVNREPIAAMFTSLCRRAVVSSLRRRYGSGAWAARRIFIPSSPTWSTISAASA